MRRQWHDDANRKLRLRGRADVAGRNLVEDDDGEVRLCRFDGAHCLPDHVPTRTQTKRPLSRQAVSMR
jgi:hypothetical protein